MQILIPKWRCRILPTNFQITKHHHLYITSNADITFLTQYLYKEDVRYKTSKWLFYFLQICIIAIRANIKQFALSNEIKITNGHSKTGNLFHSFIPDLNFKFLLCHTSFASIGFLVLQNLLYICVQLYILNWNQTAVCSMFIPDLSSELDCTCFVIGVWRLKTHIYR